MVEGVKATPATTTMTVAISAKMKASGTQRSVQSVIDSAMRARKPGSSGSVASARGESGAVMLGIKEEERLWQKGNIRKRGDKPDQERDRARREREKHQPAHDERREQRVTTICAVDDTWMRAAFVQDASVRLGDG